MRISITKDQVKKFGNEIIECSDIFSQDIKKFSSIIDSINTIWSGNEALKYVNMMKEKYLPVMNSISSDVKKYGQYLKDIPEAYQILEDTFSSKKINI